MNSKYLRPVVLGLLILLVGIFFSNIFDLYYTIPHLDKVYHFLGGFTLGWFFYLYFFDQKQDQPFPNFKKILTVVSATCFIAVLWEYAERLSTLYGPQYAPFIYHWFQGGDLNDTLLDILAGTLGSLSFVSLKYLKNKINKKSVL